MKAKIKATQQVVNVHLVDCEGQPFAWTYADENGDKWLAVDLDFDDLTDYKSWTESLIHDLAVEAYKKGVPEEKRVAVAADIVLYAYAVMDRMQVESNTWE